MSAPLASSKTIGVVVSAGKMAKAVRVRIAKQEWNKQIRKHFPSSTTYLVSDPNSSLREGDVVQIASGWRSSKNIRHVVSSIVAPFGPPISERPPVPTAAELLAERQRLRMEKDVRQASRGRLASKRRVEEAKAEGREVPSLEVASARIRALEAAERERQSKGQGVKKDRGVLSEKEKRRVERGS
ncbi:nucleic acid-binding protein [Lepidopterella palustris CBS 459.81]|uniref:Nucleic acid-binding protein n=1 Tax=Lepidopterella palustris CBS 459.81 TaxID=1314670 RepID=A0A8E2E3K3_9PEZI|nr:nucleic acid-binding protein [Lepidopterella palustris CBS 459.81]